MIYTNRNNISPEIFQAIVDRQGEYSPGDDVDYSVTDLINPIQIAVLRRRHYDQLEVDVSDLLESWMGHLMHDALEKPATSMRIYRNIHADTIPKAVKISGAYDYYKNGLLKDYKRTSVWGMIYGSNIDKWAKQVNCYAALIREYLEEEVEQASIEVFLKDWSRSEARRNPNYPQVPQYKVPIVIWPAEEAEQYLLSRAEAVYRAEQLPDERLPPCTNEEMWADDNRFAVYKGNNKRASRVLDTHNEAQAWIAQQKKGSFRIEERVAHRTRCADYCDVAPFCKQWKEYQEMGDG